MPTSVLRRYTPPTCTLEVRANQSPLSRWAGQTVLRDLRFNLSLDDPQRPDRPVVNLSGDRNQLEALSEVVNAYVQRLLDTDPGAADGALRHLLPPTAQSGGDRHPDRLPFGGRSPNGTNGSPLALHTPPVVTESGIFLEPQGLLAHDLHLGSLSTADAGNVVRLSAVQLFDLANALDDYSAEVLALPGQQRTAASTRRWASIAAMLVLAVGATGGITKFVMDVMSPTASQVAQESVPESGVVESLPTTPAPASGTPLPVPGAPSPGTVATVPPAAPPGSAQPGAFPFPVQAPQANPGAVQPAPGGLPPGANPGAIAVQPVPPGAIARAPQGNPGPAPGAAQGTAVPPNPTVLRAEPDFSVSQIPSLTGGQGAAPEAAISDTAIAPPPTARNRPTTDLSRTGVEIPQVDELQSYFQDRWQPPENLNETLEYRLVFGPDGRVQQIIPLGDAAGVYIDRTGMPLLGDPVVSPLAPYQAAMVRVVLAPDGRVQTFLEEVN